MKLRLVAALGAILLLAGACGGDGDANSSSEEGTQTSEQERTLTVYSGREEEYVEGLFEIFEEQEGIELDVRYGDSAELAATLVEEGESSPADVFFAQDAGSLGAVAEAGLFAEIDQELLGRVDARFRSPEGLWIGTSGRARVAAFNTDNVSADELPPSILGFMAPTWKGRIGFPPTNSSFQAFVAGMISTMGEDSTREFLEGLMANEPKFYEDNGATTRAVAEGEVDVGFVNHYYIYEVAAEDGEEIPVENHYFSGGDPGALVNSAGAGILATAENADEASAFVDFLTSEEAQAYFAEEIWEYPVIDGVEPSVDLVPLEEIQSPDIDLSDLGGQLEPALNLLAEVGML